MDCIPVLFHSKTDCPQLESEAGEFLYVKEKIGTIVICLVYVYKKILFEVICFSAGMLFIYACSGAEQC